MSADMYVSTEEMLVAIGPATGGTIYPLFLSVSVSAAIQDSGFG